MILAKRRDEMIYKAIIICGIVFIEMICFSGT